VATGNPFAPVVRRVPHRTSVGHDGATTRMTQVAWPAILQTRGHQEKEQRVIRNLIARLIGAGQEPQDCGDIYPSHSGKPHWHVGYPTKKSQSFDRPKRSDPFDSPDGPRFVNKSRSD